MTDDLILLASAYLDGDVTLDERARVEADPSLLEEVERLRTARIALLDDRWFERPADDVREAAIAAALTAWDAAAFDVAGSISGSPPPVHTPSVLPFVRRPAYTRWLSVAAAVVVVAGLGVLIAQVGGGDDDDSAASDAPTATVARAETGAGLTEQFEAPADTADALTSSDVAADDAGGADVDSAAPAEVPTAAASGTEAPAGTEAASSSDLASEVSLTTPEQLGAFAANAKAAAENDLNRDTLARPCRDDAFDDIDTYVAMGTYLGRPVVIGIDEERGRAFAVDSDTCEIVAEAPLP